MNTEGLGLALGIFLASLVIWAGIPAVVLLYGYWAYTALMAGSLFGAWISAVGCWVWFGLYVSIFIKMWGWGNEG